MPSKTRKPAPGFRDYLLRKMPDGLLDLAMARARREGKNLKQVIFAFLESYVAEEKAGRPGRKRGKR